MPDILVVGRRPVSNNGVVVGNWLFQAGWNGAGTGSGNQGSVVGSTAFQNEEQLMEAIAELDQGDRIIIKVEGMPPVVIDGSLARDSSRPPSITWSGSLSGSPMAAWKPPLAASIPVSARTFGT